MRRNAYYIPLSLSFTPYFFSVRALPSLRNRKVARPKYGLAWGLCFFFYLSLNGVVGSRHPWQPVFIPGRGSVSHTLLPGNSFFRYGIWAIFVKCASKPGSHIEDGIWSSQHPDFEWAVEMPALAWKRPLSFEVCKLATTHHHRPSRLSKINVLFAVQHVMYRAVEGCPRPSFP